MHVNLILEIRHGRNTYLIILMLSSKKNENCFFNNRKIDIKCCFSGGCCYASHVKRPNFDIEYLKIGSCHLLEISHTHGDR